MINYEAKTIEEFLKLFEQELKLRQKYELETTRKMFELNNMDKEKSKKGVQTKG